MDGSGKSQLHSLNRSVAEDLEKKRLISDSSDSGNLDNLDTDLSVEERSPVKHQARWISKVTSALKTFLHYITRSQVPEKKYYQRDIVTIPPSLKIAQKKREIANQWKSNAALGGFNDLKIRNLKIALAFLESRSSLSNNTAGLIQEFREEKKALEDENEEKGNSIVTDKKVLSSIKQHAGHVKSKIVEAIARDVADEKKLSAEISNVTERLTKGKLDYLNGQKWSPVTAEFNDPKLGSLVSQQTPAAHIKTPENSDQPEADSSQSRDLFPESYNEGGVCSATSDSDKHAVNLLTSSFEQDGKVLYKGVRHGTHGAYGIKDKTLRRAAAEVRAKESVLAALSLKPELLKEALKNPNKPVPLKIVSTSLLTPAPGWLAKLAGQKQEGQMMKDQIAGFEALAKTKPLALQVVDRRGIKKTIKVDLEPLCFNFGVNRTALHPIMRLGAGWGAADKVNAKSLKALIGDLKLSSNEYGGWVQQVIEKKQKVQQAIKSEIEALQALWDEQQNVLSDEDKTNFVNQRKQLLQDNSDLLHEIDVIKHLSTQIREIFNKKSHRGEHDDPYKMPARIVLLTYLLENVPLSNCKSGKDRTGILDAEVKLLAARIVRDKKVPEPGPLSEADQALFQEILLNSGNFEVQALNTGRPGYMMSGVQSVNRRIGNKDVAIDVEGSSKAVRS